jgi:hypothetical protein
MKPPRGEFVCIDMMSVVYSVHLGCPLHIGTPML